MDSSVWDALKQVSDHGNVYKQRPSVGKAVKVIEGKKHLGAVGTVRWHGIDKYDTSAQYMTDAQVCLRDMIGRLGYRIKIETESGESFFVSADYVEVIA
jgi:hypothetical protein